MDGVVRGKNDVDGAAADAAGFSSALDAVDGSADAEDVGNIDGLGASAGLTLSLDDGKGNNDRGLDCSACFDGPSAGLGRLNGGAS